MSNMSRGPSRRSLTVASAFLLAAMVFAVGAATLARHPSHPASHAHAAAHQAPATAAAPVITLFAPDSVNRANQQATTPLDAPLPPGLPAAPSGYLAPDKPSAYELSLIAAIGTPDKVIVVSRFSQTIHVYQSGVFIAGSLAITGRPQLPTPVGVFHIFDKLAPATLYSPWGPGSAFWYPPTPVNYTMEFRTGGFLIHDAPWHHVWGPGMNDWHYDPVAREWQWGTHGCVAAPTPFVQWLYGWSPEGTTVIIY